MPLLKIVYAEESEAGTWIFGFDKDDYERIKQGYACPHCMEVFSEGDAPIALMRCTVCKKPTAIGDITQAFTDTPEDWLAYQRHRKEVLDAPARRS